MARKYEQKARAAGQEETKRRITEATVELHRTVGPARTTISAIAEKAGVQRLTVYRHFPDERDLLAACSAHWLGADPPPDITTWTDTPAALAELYAWYRRNEPMLANTARDAPSMPALAEIADPTPFSPPPTPRSCAGGRGASGSAPRSATHWSSPPGARSRPRG